MARPSTAGNKNEEGNTNIEQWCGGSPCSQWHLLKDFLPAAKEPTPNPSTEGNSFEHNLLS